MIACQYYTVGFANSYPTGGFQGLGSFINKKCTEVTPVQYTVIAADKGGSYDMGIVKKIGIDLYFQLCGTITQATHTIAGAFTFLITAPMFATHFTHGFTDTP